MQFEDIKNTFFRIAAIGQEENGGVNRIFGSDSIKECQSALKSYFEDCGMQSYVDSVGNVHGIYGRTEQGEILIGSHYDSVKCGGMFDGLLGIVMGAEIVRKLKKDQTDLKKKIHIVAFNGEEGNELGGTFGSRAAMGMLDLENQEFLTKAAKYGLEKKDLENAVLDMKNTAGYLELHIEQGPTLENNHEKIGIVTGIVGLRRYLLTVHGVSNHAGTTMMEDRNDALVHAAKIILLGDEMAKAYGNHMVETVGIVHVYPGSAPVIPDKVEMVVEIRNESNERMDCFIQEFRKRSQQIADIELEPMVRKEPVQCSEEFIEKIEKACIGLEVPYRKMPSGATHDGSAIAYKVPIGMVFLPSCRGISHSKEEWTDWEDIETGLRVFYQVIKQLVVE